MPQLSYVERAKIIAYLEDGVPVREVARLMNKNKNTIQKLKNRWEVFETIEKEKPPGRPRITTQEEDAALVNYLRDHPFEVARNAIERTHFSGSRPTAFRRIKESPLGNYVAAKKMILKEEHKQARVLFAINNTLRENWDKVVFSDEKNFQSTFNGHVRVYRPRGTRFQESYINNSERSGRFSVNIWAWISYQGLGVCWTMEERFNAVNYRNILENIMLPSVLEHFPNRDFIFQQDNCPVHNAGIIREWFQQNNIETLLWPSKSPDFNIIENIWGLMTKRMYDSQFRPQNREALVAKIVETWEELTETTPNLITNLYSSIPTRLNDALGKNGAMTKY